MYTLPNQPEVGRVFVYNNVAVSSLNISEKPIQYERGHPLSSQGSLTEARTIVGDVSYARFGYAVANLGDINGDGLDGE